MKWAEDEDASFTLANLTAVDDSSGKSLLQKIAEGFRQIQGLEGTKTVVLYSTRSCRDKRPARQRIHQEPAGVFEGFSRAFSRRSALNSDIEKAANYRRISRNSRYP